MKYPKIIIFFVSWFGAIAGALFLIAVHPQEDFFYLIVLFAIFGVIAANLILLGIFEISKVLKSNAD
jgi:hypothetical protein